MYLLGQNRGYSSNVVDTNAGNIDYVPDGVVGNTVYLDTTTGLIDYVVIPPFYSNVTLGANVSNAYWENITLTWENINTNWNN